jgi:uncharacterized membrane protein YhhN
MDSWQLYSVWALVCSTGLFLALGGEYRGHGRISGAGKFLAATSYIGAALSLGAAGSGYGRVLLVGMVFCWLGDMLLLSRRSQRLFLLGLASFLAGHFVYVCAFAVRGISFPALVPAAIATALFGWRVAAWLKPHLDQRLRTAVGLYLFAISAMVAMAVATFTANGGLALLLGALLFAVSDLSVARNRFVSSGFVNRAWGLPIYFLAQLLLAASVAP